MRQDASKKKMKQSKKWKPISWNMPLTPSNLEKTHMQALLTEFRDTLSQNVNEQQILEAIKRSEKMHSKLKSIRNTLGLNRRQVTEEQQNSILQKSRKRGDSEYVKFLKGIRKRSMKTDTKVGRSNSYTRKIDKTPNIQSRDAPHKRGKTQSLQYKYNEDYCNSFFPQIVTTAQKDLSQIKILNYSIRRNGVCSEVTVHQKKGIQSRISQKNINQREDVDDQSGQKQLYQFKARQRDIMKMKMKIKMMKKAVQNRQQQMQKQFIAINNSEPQEYQLLANQYLQSIALQHKSLGQTLTKKKPHPKCNSMFSQQHQNLLGRSFQTIKFFQDALLQHNNRSHSLHTNTNYKRHNNLAQSLNKHHIPSQRIITNPQSRPSNNPKYQLLPIINPKFIN